MTELEKKMRIVEYDYNKSGYKSYKMEIKADDEIYSNFTYVEKHIGHYNFITGKFYPGKDYDYGAREMTELELKIRLADLAVKSALAYTHEDIKRIVIEQVKLVEQLLERKKKHE